MMMDYGMDALALEEYSLGYRARLAGMMLLEGARSNFYMRSRVASLLPIRSTPSLIASSTS
jgi:hypothetical protein